MKLLFVIDMQNDFIYGALGNPEALIIVPKVIEKIKNADMVIFTQDSHYNNYLDTEEGKHLPVKHCIVTTEGWEINAVVLNALGTPPKSFIIKTKETFGYDSWRKLSFIIEKSYNSNMTENEIEIVGLDTDFCVLANAMTLKAAFPNVPITIDAACCAGSTPEWHEKALDILEHCHFNVINRKEEE